MNVGADDLPRGSGPVVVGREAELQGISRFLASIMEGPRAFLITGDAGVGKTTLWEAALAEARGLHYLVLTTRARASESYLGLSGIADLIGPVAEATLPRLPGPQRRALEVVLGLSTAVESLDRRILGLGVRTLFETVSAEQPVLIGIDDLQWLDSDTEKLLVFALRRLPDAQVGLVATVRTDADAAAASALEQVLGAHVKTVTLRPLPLVALERLLEQHLGARLSNRALRQVYRRSGANPFYAIELARTLNEDDDQRLPPSLRGRLVRRLERLPVPTRELLVVLAAAATPTVSLVRELGNETGLDPAEREGIVIVEQQRIRFTHPLLAEAVLETATSRQRQDANRLLAGLIQDPEQRSRHLALATDSPSEDVAATIDLAAQSALARGATAAAAELAERALALTPQDHSISLHRRRLLTAQRMQTLGNTSRQRELLEQALADAPTRAGRAEPLWRLSTLELQDGRGAEARGMVEEALACADDDALRAAILMDSSWLDHGFFGTVERATAALEHAEKARNPRLLAVVLSTLAGALFARGMGLRRDLFERAVELEREVGFIDADYRPTTRYGWAAKWAGDIPLSRELLEGSAARALEEEDASRASVLFYLAWLYLIVGEWELALEHADAARELSADAGLEEDAAKALVTRATVEAYQGHLAAAVRHVEQTRRLTEGRGPLWPFAAALIALVSGEPSKAVATLGPAIQEMRNAGIEEPGLFPWFPTYAEALMQAGHVEEAQRLVDWLEPRALRLQRRWACAMCAHYRGAILATRGDTQAAVGALEQAVELHNSVGRPFDRACTLLTYGQTLRRAKRKRPAREALESARAEFRRLGATGWAEAAERELMRIGGRAPGPNRLTPAEERVAALVATGKSNKEVAAELFLTVRTVETTLSRVYAKLGVRSRGQLAARQSLR